jgi:hypothetical protein
MGTGEKLYVDKDITVCQEQMRTYSLVGTRTHLPSNMWWFVVVAVPSVAHTSPRVDLHCWSSQKFQFSCILLVKKISVGVHIAARALVILPKAQGEVLL